MNSAALVLAILSILTPLATTANVQELKICKTLEINNRDYQRHKNVTRLQATLNGLVNGCQYVNGDLLFNHLGVNPADSSLLNGGIRFLNTSFLDSIQEVTGKVIFRVVGIARLELRNLRVIRGYHALESANSSFFAMEIQHCFHQTHIVMPRLSAIAAAGVLFTEYMNHDLYCQLTKKISWSQLFQSKDQHLTDAVAFLTNSNETIARPENQTAICSHLRKCHENCPADHSGRRLCWAGGSGDCQLYSKCRRRSCFSNACYTSPDGAEECCDSSCLGGCHSHTASACHSCRDVSLHGKCQQMCPSVHYNPKTGRIVESARPMLRAGNVCVSKCPPTFLVDSHHEYCVAECRPEEIPIRSICTGCSAAGRLSTCRTCNVTKRVLTTELASSLVLCFTLQSQMDSNNEAFSIDGKELKSAETLNVLESVRVVMFRNFVIKNMQSIVTNLGFLKNLVQVSGALYIHGAHISHLGLASLKYAESLTMREVRGLCPAWFPTRFFRDSKYFPVRWPSTAQKDLAFDNSSAECRNAVCDPHCLDECWGPGPDMCVECRNFKVDGRCYATCQEANKYPKNATCLPCHSQCIKGCSGPTASECVLCRHGIKEHGSCVATCSQGMRADSGGECYSVASARLVGVGVGVGLLLLALIVLLPLAYLYYRKRMQKYDMVDLDEYLTDPSNPNDMARLLIVNDDDVVKQKEIGSGAFGTVFKGVLRSSTVKGVRELPVAIKVLRGHSPKLGQELLNEASVLARVRHPYCIRLVALCLTQDLQLITALMPRGCLLDFVRAHRNRIGAERMLRWALQVAEGMEYLESLGIVHRDLAARNVLLQTPDQVRITDFGLARLLDLTEGEFVQTAGLLPVKWLGQECLESGLFSHKSDVWSYGVLLWEICTFGESPYNPYGIRSVEDITGLLKKGIRLNQPDVCSIDFFNIMLSCWLPHPESRPSFKDMVSTMNECLLIPSKYIAVGRSTMDANQFDASEVLGFESEPAKPFSKDQGKHLELNTYISDPTNQPPRLRNAPKFVTPSSDASEAAALLHTLSSDDADGYLTPKSPTDKDNHPNGPGGLDDYLTPTKV